MTALQEKFNQEIFTSQNIFRASRFLPGILLSVALPYFFMGLAVVAFVESAYAYVGLSVCIGIQFVVSLYFKMKWNNDKDITLWAVYIDLACVSGIVNLILLISSVIMGIEFVGAAFLNAGDWIILWVITLFVSRINFLSTSGIYVVGTLTFISAFYSVPLGTPLGLAFAYNLPLLATGFAIFLIRKKVFQNTKLEPKHFGFSFWKTGKEGLDIKS